MAAATLLATAQPAPISVVPGPTAAPVAPLIASSPTATPGSLSVQINTTTRHIHTDLNRLITARIPLALPPSTDSPDLYLYGIHVFAELYFAFEAAWQDLISAHTASKRDAHKHLPPHTRRLLTYLAHLIDPRLWRTQRLEGDISHLRTIRAVSLPDLESDDTVAAIRARITASIAAKPHILLAYAWVMYMAIFSGGRWIRSQLAQAGDAFWGHTGEHERDAHIGFGLFYFATPSDGDDLKTAFKTRFAEADHLLTPAEKLDVLAAAADVFDMCTQLVLALDVRLASSSPTSDPAVSSPTSSTASASHSSPRKTVTPAWNPLSRIAARSDLMVFNGVSTGGGLSIVGAVLIIFLGAVLWHALRNTGWAGKILEGIIIGGPDRS